ncbi:MAG: carboxypeptidase-like regulatory domain-containing protein [Flavobacteriaceae bacterium]|nr:carboxypeptidase-like regulatory domain-containing protein [Flavobacteriaceae bacterium]
MRYYFLNLFTVLLLLCSVNVTFSKNTDKIILYGKILSDNQKPIPQALVAVEGTSLGAYAYANGQYKINLKSGKKYTIVISSLGYKTLKTSIQLTKNTQQNFTLEQDIIALQGVAVKGKSKSRRIKESSFAVNALNVQSQTNTHTNLHTLVGKSSGIQVRESGGVGSETNLSINGLSGKSVRYFIDGVPMSSLGTGVSLANLPVNIVEHIEIYKGVVPTHLGADALGGAINIVTKNTTQNYLDASYTIGSFGMHKTNVNAQYISKKTGIIVKPMFAYITAKNNYKMKDVEVWDERKQEFLLADRERFHDRYTSLIAQIEAGVRGRKWCDNFSVSASYSKTNKELQTGTTQKIVYGKAGKKTQSYRLAVRYKKSDFFAPNLHANISLSYTNNSYKVIDTAFRKYDWNGEYIKTSRSEIMGRERSIRHIDRPLFIGRTNFDYKINAQHSLNLNYLFSRIANKRTDEVATDFEDSEDVLSKNIIGLSYQQKFLKNNLVNTFFVKDYLSFLDIKQADLSWITNSKDKQGNTTTNNWGYGLASRYKLTDALFLKASFEHSLRLPRSR